MNDVTENAGGISEGAPPRAALSTGSGDGGSSIWRELRARRVKASRRIGEGWERVSEGAKDYADDHAIGVALGSLVAGIAVGALIGVLIGRD